MRPLLLALDAGDDTFAFARSYALCVIVCGGIPTVLTNILSNLVRSVGESRKAGFGVTLGGIANIGLDPLVMFVLLPPGHEIFGAGLATFISNCISCTYFLIVIRRLGGDSVLRLGFPRALPEKASIRRIFSVGVPSCVATFLFDVDFAVIGRLMSGYGTALFLGVMRWAVFNIPLLFLLNRLLGMMGIVWAQLCGDVLTVALSVLVHRRFQRRKAAARPLSPAAEADV